MIHALETPEQTAHRCARELRESLRRAGRHYLKYAETIDALHVTMGVKHPPKTVDTSADLPPQLRRARPSLRMVYRAVRDMRDQLGTSACVWPLQIVAWLDDRDSQTAHSIDTVNHALRDLAVLKLACSEDPAGWRLGTRQLSLPISGGQSESPSDDELEEYALDMAGRGVRRFQAGGFAMKRLIWVPGEKSEYGIVVTDASTEEAIAVSERVGEMQVPTWSGKVRTVPAVRAELVRVDGKYVLVKLPGGHQLATRVLGDWQLEGRAAPEEVGAA